MANRPTFIDLRSRSHGPIGAPLPSPRGSPRGPLSPRFHVAWDIPPNLSPLDAFAAQSRLLARQLEESVNEGKRISRLPPLTMEHHLAPRPGFIRSVSAEPTASDPIIQQQFEPSGQNPEFENPGFRPVSVHPQLSGVASTPAFGFPRTAARLETHAENEEEQFRGRRPPSGHGHPDFGSGREQSPPGLDMSHRTNQSRNINSQPSVESMRQQGQRQRRPQDVSLGINGYDSRALAPPRSPYAQRTPSPRSVISNDSSDEDYKNSNHRPALDRSFSGGSGFSTSPISSPTATHHFMARSPSISSEISVGGTTLPRPAFNFSRPISRSSMHGISAEVPSRQASSDSQPSFVLADDTVHTPVSMHGEGFPEMDQGGAASYVYSRFSLPRGKMLQRNSMIFQDSPQAQHSWDQQNPASGEQPYDGSAPPSPPSRPSLDPGRPTNAHPPQTRPSLDPGRPSAEHGFNFGRPSLDPSRPSYERGQNSGSFDRERFSAERGQPSPSIASSATIKARSQHSLAPSSEWSGEEHVTKAIEYHEAGALTKSTYHLRLAARQNHPTGMLLYALACRHGWGMRPNQKEGVQWLRKAANSASLEVADDEDHTKDGKVVDYLERKSRKAQFALSIYELGVSHMNGWGIEQDKALALRCFEIAGCKYIPRITQPLILTLM